MKICELCGKPVLDPDSDQATWRQRRVEVRDRKNDEEAGSLVAILHPRCWELLQGVVKAMIRMAQWPELAGKLR